jgi:hypothetical protein
MRGISWLAENRLASQGDLCSMERVRKVEGRHVDHPHPCSAEVKNEWSYISTPLHAFMAWTVVTLRFTNINAKSSVWSRNTVFRHRLSYALINVKLLFRFRVSSVGIGISYGLDGPGIESQWGAKFSAHVQTGPGAHPASCTMGTASFLGVKAAGTWRWPSTPSSAEVKERVDLYLYSTSGPSWPVIGWALPLSAAILSA